MSHWNYRFVAVEVNGETEIGLYEVYYDDEGKPNGRTAELATIVGDSKMEAWDALSKASSAVGQPILTDADLVAASVRATADEHAHDWTDGERVSCRICGTGRD